LPKKLLTKKKAAWVRQFKPTGAIRGGVLNYNAGVQQKYERDLLRLTRQMTEQCKRDIAKLYKGAAAKEWFSQDASVASEARKITNKLTAKFQQLFNSRAKGLAESMVNESDKASASGMHASLKELSGGLSLKTSMVTGEMKGLMTAAVAENVGLIKSIPAQYLQKIQGAVMRSITTGNGLADLIPVLDKYADEAHNRARNIALDQTRKAYNALNEGRMRKLGVQKYEWIHTGGSQHPRQYHIHMNGKIYDIDNPPIIDPRTGQRGKPGDLPNCRCRMRPIVSFLDGEETENDAAED